MNATSNDNVGPALDSPTVETGALSRFPSQAPMLFRTPIKQWIGLGYSFAVLAPLFLHATGHLPDVNNLWRLSYGILIALAYPTWAWWETIAFERWIRTVSDQSSAEHERLYFTEMRDHAKTFWTGIVTVYVATLLKLT